MADASLLHSTALKQSLDRNAWKHLGWGLPRAGERMRRGRAHPCTHMNRRLLLANTRTIEFFPGSASLGADFCGGLLGICTTTHHPSVHPSPSEATKPPPPGCLGWGRGRSRTDRHGLSRCEDLAWPSVYDGGSLAASECNLRLLLGLCEARRDTHTENQIRGWPC